LNCVVASGVINESPGSFLLLLEGEEVFPAPGVVVVVVVAATAVELILLELELDRLRFEGLRFGDGSKLEIEGILFVSK
jgi:hypothetical protein